MDKAEYMRKYRENNPVIRLHIKKTLYDLVELKCSALKLTHTEYLTKLIKKDIGYEEENENQK